MKKLLIPLGLFLSVVFLAVFGFYWWSENSKAASADSAPQDFLVVKGKGASQIGESLYSQGLIKSPLAFKIYVQVSGKAAGIQAGQFRISPNLNLVNVVDTLTKPPSELWVTIPEGLRKEEIVERFIKALEIKPGDQDGFRQEFLDQAEEGFLFPETYLFPRTASASTVVKKLRSTFDLKTKSLEAGISSSSLSLNELVTLASIIERETKTDEERAMVAGILLNRLDIGMGLQADATVQYALATLGCKSKIECDWWPDLTRENMSINSPYNTYKFQDLPPAPIANPGLSSIDAVVNPTASDYLYYLHDGDGGIHYAKTLDEHNYNVRTFLGK